MYVIVYWQYWSLLADENHDALQVLPSAVLLQPDDICVLRPLLLGAALFMLLTARINRMHLLKL
jgi:hypothetical protein